MLQSGRKVLVVDPGDAWPVLDRLQAIAGQLQGILITHRPADHLGSTDRLRKIQGAPVSSGVPLWVYSDSVFTALRPEKNQSL